MQLIYNNKYYYYYNLLLSMLITLRTYVVNAKSTHQLQQTPLFRKKTKQFKTKL